MAIAEATIVAIHASSAAQYCTYWCCAASTSCLMPFTVVCHVSEWWLLGIIMIFSRPPHNYGPRFLYIQSSTCHDQHNFLVSMLHSFWYMLILYLILLGLVRSNTYLTQFDHNLRTPQTPLLTELAHKGSSNLLNLLSVIMSSVGMLINIVNNHNVDGIVRILNIISSVRIIRYCRIRIISRLVGHR
jgi:hypothetical protein